MFLIKNRVNVLETGVAKNKNQLKSIDAPVFGYWKALYLSFFSKRIYVDVGKRWKGLGLLYLLLSIALFCIPLCLKIAYDFNRDFEQTLVNPILLLPDFYIQNGQVSFDKPMPYLVKNDKGQVVGIIDTTDKIKDFSNEYPYLNILVNKHKMYFRLPAPQVMGISVNDVSKPITMSQPFDKNMNMVFNGEQVVKDSSIYGLKILSSLMVYPLVALFLYSFLVVIFLVLAFLGQVFARIFFSFKMDFKKSSRLFMVSTTPMVLVLNLFLFMNWMFPGSGFVLLAILVFYFSYAIYSLRSESQQVVV